MVKKFELNTTMSFINFTFQSENIGNKINKLIFECPKISHVNVSFVAFAFAGQRVKFCSFGGLLLFDVINSKLHYLTSFCSQDVLDWKNLPNTYSEYNSLLLVIYSYYGYSDLFVHLNVSVTRCFPVRVDPCNFDWHLRFRTKHCLSVWRLLDALCFNLDRYECAVIQVTTDKNNAKTREVFKTFQCFISFEIGRTLNVPRKFQYKVSGYLPMYDLHPEGSEQYLRIGGTDYEHNKEKDTKVFEWTNDESQELPVSELGDFYNENRIRNIKYKLNSDFYWESTAGRHFHPIVH